MKLLFFILSILLSTSIMARMVVLEKSNTVSFKDEFTYESTTKLMANVSKLIDAPFVSSLSHVGIRPTIYIMLDTPGGSIDAGLKATDMLTSLMAKGYEIKTISLFSASMGSHLVESLGERLLTPTGTLLFHKAKGGFEGEFGDGKSQIDSRYNYWLKRILHMQEVAVNRTNGKHTLASFRELIADEYWCEGNDCVKQGLADAVVDVVCGKSLSGDTVVKQQLNFMGMTFNVAYKLPNCPILDVYDVEVAVGDEKVKKLEDPSINSDLRTYIMKQISPRTAFSKAVSY